MEQIQNSERSYYQRALRLLIKKFGPIPIADFGPVKLQEFQNWLITNEFERKYKDRNGKVTKTRKYFLTRTTAKHLIRNLRAVFKWGVSQELVPPHQLVAIQSLAGLKRGIVNEPRAPVEWSDVEKMLLNAPPALSAMVQLHWLTGCRSQDICGMKSSDINCNGPLWEWVIKKHKTAHRGQKRILHLGPKAQTILKPWLNTEAHCFLTVFGRPFRSDTYGKSVLNALAKLTDPPLARPHSRERFEAAGIPFWTPHQLRHARATEIREQFGIEAAQAVLGHASLQATQIYAKRQVEIARQIAREAG
jgi:integrase